MNAKVNDGYVSHQICEEAGRSSGIYDELDHLEKRIAGVSERVITLRDRLSPVLLPERPQNEEGFKEVAEYSVCPVASRIGDFQKRLANVHDELHDILELLDV